MKTRTIAQLHPTCIAIMLAGLLALSCGNVPDVLPTATAGIPVTIEAPGSETPGNQTPGSQTPGAGGSDATPFPTPITIPTSGPTPTPAPPVEFAGLSYPITGLAWSPDGSLLAVTVTSGGVRVFATASGDLRYTIFPEEGAGGAAFSPDGTLLATGHFDHKVRLSDANSGELVRLLEGPGSIVNEVAFGPGGLLAAASEDGKIWVWDAANGELRFTLEGHEQSVTDVDFNPGGTMLVSGGWDFAARLWNVERAEQARLLHQSNADGVVFAADFNRSGDLVALAMGSGDVFIYDRFTGENTNILEGHLDVTPAVDFSPVVGAILASGSVDGTVRLWHADQVVSLLTYDLAALTGYEPVLNVAFSPDGSQLAIGTENGRVYLWAINYEDLVK